MVIFVNFVKTKISEAFNGWISQAMHQKLKPIAIHIEQTAPIEPNFSNPRYITSLIIIIIIIIIIVVVVVVVVIMIMIISMFWEDSIFSLNVSLPYDPLVNADTIIGLTTSC